MKTTLTTSVTVLLALIGLSGCGDQPADTTTGAMGTNSAAMSTNLMPSTNLPAMARTNLASTNVPAMGGTNQ